ncbi:MAG: hypothetical protein AAFU71_19650, partial [Cyanobacteria bacterium J06632_22]
MKCWLKAGLIVSSLLAPSLWATQVRAMPEQLEWERIEVMESQLLSTPTLQNKQAEDPETAAKRARADELNQEGVQLANQARYLE